MVINIIFTVLMLVAGSIFAISIPLFGVKFGRESSKSKSTQKSFLKQMVSDYPFWIWIIAFLVAQPCFFQILNIWFPTIFSNHEWIISFSSFVGFITMILFLIFVIATNENGKFKS